MCGSFYILYVNWLYLSQFLEQPSYGGVRYKYKLFGYICLYFLTFSQTEQFIILVQITFKYLSDEVRYGLVHLDNIELGGTKMQKSVSFSQDFFFFCGGF
jgi:hypothetical protein